MVNINPAPQPVPPQTQPLPPPFGRQRPLGENPEERAPIPNPFTAIEAILRQPRRVMFQLRQPGAGALILKMLLVATVCSLIYGVVVGTYSQGQQYWIAPVKIAGGMLFSALI